METYKYSIMIVWDDRDEIWIATCPELGVSVHSSSQRGLALVELEGLLEDACAAYAQDGESVPAPKVYDPPHTCRSCVHWFRCDNVRSQYRHRCELHSADGRSVRTAASYSCDKWSNVRLER